MITILFFFVYAKTNVVRLWAY